MNLMNVHLSVCTSSIKYSASEADVCTAAEYSVAIKCELWKLLLEIFHPIEPIVNLKEKLKIIQECDNPQQ